MADNRRVHRYADMIKKTVSNIIELKLKDPGKGFITVTAVRMSADLKIASVYYTVLGDEEQRRLTAAVLKRSIPFLRSELKPYITSRWIPELRFFYDETLEQAEKINALLEKIKNDSHSD
ncbi:MAG TPA: 30S ribosome-binding factor RbfA [Calditrichaeota bacterium]|nr:30S ribosome-binding factor RbfA [Calditrichota bacterium]